MLNRAYLKNAKLQGAILKQASLSGADFTDAELKDADLQGAKFFQTKGITPSQIKSAKNWQVAYYDSDLLKDLELPDDHNEKVRIELSNIKQNHKEEE